jgi:hypothetical protein
VAFSVRGGYFAAIPGAKGEMILSLTNLLSKQRRSNTLQVIKEFINRQWSVRLYFLPKIKVQ